MAKKMIKHLLYTWYEEVDDPTNPDPKATVLRERIVRLGQVVDITREADVRRGEKLDSFYTDAERKQIEEGTYRGIDAQAVYAARGNQQPISQIQPADGEHGGDVAILDAAALGQYIAENSLTIPQVLDLVPEDADLETIQKFIDAENIASGNDPRKGLVDTLESRQANL